MSDLKSRIQDLLNFYLTMVSLIEAIVLTQLVSRAATVSGGTFLEGWSIALGLQVLLVLATIVAMWVGYLTMMAPIRRAINSNDYLNTYFLGAYQLIGVQLIENEITTAYMVVMSIGMLSAIYVTRANLNANLADDLARAITRTYPYQRLWRWLAIGSAALVSGALILMVDTKLEGLFAAVFLVVGIAAMCGFFGTLLVYWTRLIAVPRISDPGSTSSLRFRLSEMMSLQLTMISMIEAIVLEAAFSRVAEISGGSFFDGWTVNLALQAAAVMATVIAIWVTAMADLIPVRRLLNKNDMVNMIMLGLVQLIGVQVMAPDIHPLFLVMLLLGGIGAIVIRFQNRRTGLNDPEARGIVMLFPHARYISIAALMIPAGLIGAVMVSDYPIVGQVSTLVGTVSLAAITLLCLSWWDRVMHMHRFSDSAPLSGPRSRVRDVLSLYLTMLSLFEAIVLEQLVVRIAQVSGGNFLDGWTFDLGIQVALVLLSVLLMWIGYMTVTAPVRRTITATDLLNPFLLGAYQLIGIHVIEPELSVTFMVLVAFGFGSAVITMRAILKANLSDDQSRGIIKIYPLKLDTLLRSSVAAVAGISAIVLPLSKKAGLYLAELCILLSAVILVMLLNWWRKLTSMHRFGDAAPNTRLKSRVSEELLSFYMILINLIETIVLAMVVTRIADVTGGRFLEGWTLEFGLQVATVFASTITIWVAFMTDLVPIRRIIHGFDLIGIIMLGFLQMTAVQIIEMEVQPLFLWFHALGGVGGATIRYINHRAGLSDRVARGFVKLYPQAIIMTILLSFIPVSIIGALAMTTMPMVGYASLVMITVLYVVLVGILLSWWDKMVAMRRIR